MRLRNILLGTVLLVGHVLYGQLPLPVVPVTLTRPVDRADYIAVHFYDGMDWNDKVLTAQDNLMQDWANFLSVLPHCSAGMRDSVIVSFLHSVPGSFVPVYSDMADGYLFATDSELCDEVTYLKVLGALASHPDAEPGYRQGLVSRLEYLSRCAPGTKAVSINVETLDGSVACGLDTLMNRARNILLVFYDPDCEDCHAVLDELSGNGRWKSLIDSGQLLVVKAEITDETDALYPILTVPSLYHLSGASLDVIARNIPLSDLDLIP